MTHLPMIALVFAVACPDTKDGLTVHNTAPNASIDSPVEGASFDGGETVEFTGRVGDNEDGPSDLVLTWSSDLDGVLQVGIPAYSDGSTLLTTAALSPGEHLISLHVADTKSKSGEDTLSILVVDAEATPEVHILRPSGSDIGSETADFSFEAVATDAQDLGPELELAFWADDGSGEVLLCEATPNVDGLGVCEAGLDAGLYDLIATIIDTDGNLSQDRVKDFTVQTAEESDDDLDGYTELEGDCDDANDNVHPGAPEVANGVDDDCDGEIDEDTDDFDDDEDGFSELEGDCNDDDASIYPGASESLNELDDDCDGTVDETTVAYDDDGDCFCEEAPCTGSIATDCADIVESDCDDGDEDIHPEAVEICDDVDNDCDGDVDSDDSDTDMDADGYSACDGEDCDDDDSTVNPDATERCDGIDNDCDGTTDEADAADAPIWYADLDGDTYGDPGASEIGCDAPTSYVLDATDCDDLASGVHPGATEVCDSADTDEDCDGGADDADPESASGATIWFADMDSDGYGDSSEWTYACDLPSGHVFNNDDCDDWDEDAHPGLTETCDGVDNNCDGEIDEEDSTGCENYYLDADGDGFGHETARRCLCEPEPSAGYDSRDNTDCCDSSYVTNTDETDYHTTANSCGSYDWDCSGSASYRWSDYGSCGSSLSWDLCYDDPSGWDGSIPYCGNTDDWLYDCHTECDWWDCSCEADTSVKTQECR
jgi:hypothetical protein